MSFDNPFGGLGGEPGGFMSGMFADVLKLMQAQDPSHMELVTQLALSICGDPNEPNVDPKDRILTEELTRVAELHVADVTGMPVVPSGRPLSVRALGRTAWTTSSLQRWRTTLEAIVKAQGSAAGSGLGAAGGIDRDESDTDTFAQLMQGWLAMVGPALSAMQIGSIVGHLATRTLGQYDLLLPGDFTDGPAVIPANRRKFAEDWSLPENDVTLWTATNDICLHAVLSRPHVSERLRALVVDHATSLKVDPTALRDQLADLGSSPPTNLSELAAILGDPTALVGSPESEEARRHQRELETLVTVVRGYADWVTRAVARRAIGTGSAIAEAMARARMDRSAYEQAADALLGVEQSPALYDRGRRFVEGVIEREGEQDLAKLWLDERLLPTPAELDAPGLWIERINLA